MEKADTVIDRHPRGSGRLRAGLLLPLLFGSNGCGRAETSTAGSVMPGTPYETPYYVKTGDDPRGPKVCIIGGLHGDEPAGYLAARRLVGWRITRGTLIVLPEANREAIRAQARGGVNRLFPGDPKGSALQRLAYGIWHVVDYHRPGLLLTLHESRDFHRLSPSHFGQTLCHDFPTVNPLAQRGLDRVNPDLPDALHRFTIFVKPYPTCPTYCAWSRLRIPATSIETCRRDPLEERVRYQLMMCMGFFDEAGLGYEPSGVARLSTASQPPRMALPAWAPYLLGKATGQPPAAPPAVLFVSCSAGEAKVYVDGYYKGVTPATVGVQAGPGGRRVRVRVVREGHAPYEEEAALSPGEEAVVTAELKPAGAPGEEAEKGP